MKPYQDLIAAAGCPVATDTARKEAFDELVRRFQAMVLRQARGILRDDELARDAAQETFIAAYANIDGFLNPEAFPAWIRKITASQCSRVLRKRTPDVDTAAALEHLEAGDESPEKELERQELRERIERAIDQLPPHERQVTRLFYLEDYTYRDITDETDIPEKTVKSRLYSSRRRLQRSMRDVWRSYTVSNCFGEFGSPHRQTRGRSFVFVAVPIHSTEYCGMLVPAETLAAPSGLYVTTSGVMAGTGSCGSGSILG